MIAFIDNRSSRPDDEVERIIRFAADAVGPLEHGKVAIRVKDGEASGHAYERHLPKWAGRNAYAVYLTIVSDDHWQLGWAQVCWHSTEARRLAEQGLPSALAEFQLRWERGERRLGRWPIYVAHDWRDQLVHLAAHELAHVLAYDRDRAKGRTSEVQCELTAERVLDEWQRLTNATASGIVAVPSLNPKEVPMAKQDGMIDLAKIGQGKVWHILDSAEPPRPYCGAWGEIIGGAEKVDARAVRHRGANVCASCRNLVGYRNMIEGDTTMNELTDDLQARASEAADGTDDEAKPEADPKPEAAESGSSGAGGTATATRQRARGGRKTTTTRARSSAGDKGKKPLSAIKAAEEILRKEGKPLHVKELTKRILAMPNTKLGGKTPDATVGAILAVNCKKPGSVFQRTKPGTYKIRKGK